MGAMRQKRIDSEDKVRESEVLDRHSMGQLFLEQKVHRQHHQRHVMMPSVPLAHLVLSHAQAVLGFSEGVFDPKAHRLHRGELMERGIGLGVGERELDGVGTIDFAAQEEMPTPGVVFLAVPQPHARTEHLDGNEAFLATTQHDASPSRSGLGLEPLAHRDGTGLRAKEARWSSHRRSSVWNRRSRVLQEEVLVTAYLPEGDPFIVEFPQQPPSTAIDCIEGHMSETYPMAPRPEDHLPCKLHLALRHSRRCRDLYCIVAPYR